MRLAKSHLEITEYDETNNILVGFTVENGQIQKMIILNNYELNGKPGQAEVTIWGMDGKKIKALADVLYRIHERLPQVSSGICRLQDYVET